MPANAMQSVSRGQVGEVRTAADDAPRLDFRRGVLLAILMPSRDVRVAHPCRFSNFVS
jgi:hypothetical protein